MSISVLCLLYLACIALASPLAADVDGSFLNGRDAQALAQRGASIGGTVQAALTKYLAGRGPRGRSLHHHRRWNTASITATSSGHGDSDFWMCSATFSGNNGGACCKY
jgi:hypothetical protein